jgi:hypothetical protein
MQNSLLPPVVAAHPNAVPYVCYSRSSHLISSPVRAHIHSARAPHVVTAVDHSTAHAALPHICRAPGHLRPASPRHLVSAIHAIREKGRRARKLRSGLIRSIPAGGAQKHDRGAPSVCRRRARTPPFELPCRLSCTGIRGGQRGGAGAPWIRPVRGLTRLPPCCPPAPSHAVAKQPPPPPPSERATR